MLIICDLSLNPSMEMIAIYNNPILARLFGPDAHDPADQSLQLGQLPTGLIKNELLFHDFFDCHFSLLVWWFVSYPLQLRPSAPVASSPDRLGGARLLLTRVARGCIFSEQACRLYITCIFLRKLL